MVTEDGRVDGKDIFCYNIHYMSSPETTVAIASFENFAKSPTQPFYNGQVTLAQALRECDSLVAVVDALAHKLVTMATEQTEVRAHP